MLKIGITGGIGSGKTTVCRIFEALGIPVFNADQVAKSIMNTDAALMASIKEIFGKQAYFKNGELNRKYLASQVFSNQKALNVLNSLVHPAAIQAFEDWYLEQNNGPYVLKEAAILFESGSYKNCDFNILILSPETLRIRRVMERDEVDEESVRARINKQMAEEEKEKLADFTIINDEKKALIPQVLKLNEHFITISRSKAVTNE